MNVSHRRRARSLPVRRSRSHRGRLLVESLEERTLLTASPIPVGGDPIVNPADFRVTVFASGLDYPHGMTTLADGSVLVGEAELAPGHNSYYDGENTGRILRLVDSNGDGVADSAGAVVYSGLPGQITALHRGGDYVVATSSLSGSERISVLKVGATPDAPLTLAGSFDFSFPSGWEHTTFGSAIRAKPGQPGSYDLVFNIGSQFNGVVIGSDGNVVLDADGNPTFQPTLGTVGVSGLATGTLNGDSLYMVTLTDQGGTPVASDLTQIATGLRNAVSLAFDPVSGDLILADNGIDGNNFSNNAWSTDEIDVVPADDLGTQIVNFGYPYSYVKSIDAPGDPVTVRDPDFGVQPVVAFQPLPDSASSTGYSKSEGSSGFALAPPMFPAGLNQGAFTGFHGKFNSGGLANDENPLVYADLVTGQYFNFISNEVPNVGHLDEIMSTADSLFVADISSSGTMFGAGGPGGGVIYQIKAINHAPVLTAVPTQHAIPGQTLNLQITATDPDPGQTVRYSLGAGAPAGAAIDPATGAFSWTPTADAVGVPVTVIATDDGSPVLSASQTFLVNVFTNHAPVLTAIPTQHAIPGQVLRLQVAATDPDPGQTIRYSLGAGAPTGAAIDPVTGVFTWTPTEDATGVPVTVIATDDDSPALSDSETFLVNVITNHPPVLTAVPPQRVLAGTTLSLQIVATDPDPGQTLRYSLGADAPAGAAIDPDTGAFSWTPTHEAADVPVTVIATDDGSPVLSASRTFPVTVFINHPPVLADIASQHVVEGALFALQIVATDPDPGQTLRYSLGADAPAGAAIDPFTGIFTWTPQQVLADAPVTVSVTDDGTPVLSDSRTFHIQVADAPIDPIGTPASVVATQGSTTGLLVVASFLDADRDGSSTGYTATIDWGDRTRTTGKASFVGAGVVQVAGEHVYGVSGTYSVIVTLRDGDGATAVSSTTTVTVQPPPDVVVVFADGFSVAADTGFGLWDVNTQAASRETGAAAPVDYQETVLTAAGTARDSFTVINPVESPGTLRLANSLDVGQPFTFVSPARNFRHRRWMNQRIHVAVKPLGPGSAPGGDHWAGLVFGDKAGAPRSIRGTGVLLDGAGNYQIWNRRRLVKAGRIETQPAGGGFHSIDVGVNLRTGRYTVELDGRSVFQGRHRGAYSSNYISLESLSTSGSGTQYSDFDDLAVEAILQNRRLGRGR